MLHAISSHLWRQHRMTTTWLEKTQDAGFAAVEIFCATQHFDWNSPDQIADLKAWFKSNPLQLHSLHSPMFSDRIGLGAEAAINICELEKRKRVAHVDEVKRALEVAEQLPFRYLIQHVGTPTETWDDHKIDSLFSSLEELRIFSKARGVELLLENIPNEMSTPTRLNQILRITHLDFGYCFDVGHANLMEGGVEGAFDLMKDRIKSTHVHDNNGSQDAHLFPFLRREGTVDWTKTIRLLRSRGQQYPLLLELKEDPQFDAPLSAARDVIDRFENIKDHDEAE
jgi:sugar phosphate isomerase/epimerase